MRVDRDDVMLSVTYGCSIIFTRLFSLLYVVISSPLYALLAFAPPFYDAAIFYAMILRHFDAMLSPCHAVIFATLYTLLISDTPLPGIAHAAMLVPPLR